MTRVLLAEDDQAIAEPLARALRREGYTVEVREDGPSALKAALEPGLDLLVLDLGLPGMDGLEVCRRMRAEGGSAPVLVLTARADEVDTVVGLDAGADDYVTKPYGMGEVRARVAALLRRVGGPAGEPSGVLRNGSIALDPVRRVVTVGHAELDLTPREYELLKQMLAAPGRVLTRGRLLRAVWGTAYSDEGHYLHVYVSRLRRKLAAADPGGDAKDLVAAEPGVGYRVRERGD